MLWTLGLVVADLTTGNKIALAAFGIAFVVFALVSSFVLPRRNPNFPGRGLGWYVVLVVLFFVAMLSAVIAFGKESEEVRGEAPVHTETRSGSLPGQASTPTSTSTV